MNRWQIGFDVDRLKSIQLLLLRTCLAGRRCPCPVLIDEPLQLFLFGNDGCVCSFITNTLFFNLLQIRSNLPGVQGEFPPRQIQSLFAGCGQESPIV